MTYVILIYLSPLHYNGETLIIPCEIAVKSVIPSIKAAIAKELVEKYGLKQSQAAELLGISQSAVSKYTRHVRGRMIKIENVEEIKPLIDEMVSILIERKQKRIEFLQIFCQTCLLIRKTGLMCEFCRKTEPKITTEECKFCLSQDCFYSKTLFKSDTANSGR